MNIENCEKGLEISGFFKKGKEILKVLNLYPQRAELIEETQKYFRSEEYPH